MSRALKLVALLLATSLGRALAARRRDVRRRGEAAAPAAASTAEVGVAAGRSAWLAQVVEPGAPRHDRSWWRTVKGGAPRHYLRGRLQRRLDANPELLPLVLDFLPVRFSMAAAVAVDKELGWSVFVWEVAFAPGAAAGGPRSQLRHVVRLPGPVELNHPLLRFLANSDVLLTHTVSPRPGGPAEASDAMFWWGAGNQSVSLVAPGAQLLADSPRGDLIAGLAGDDRLPSIWAVPGGRAAKSVSGPRVLEQQDTSRRWVHAAFSPGGDMIAALVAIGVYPASSDGWGIEVWNTTSGAQLCGSDWHENVSAWKQTFAFDGERVAICRGSTASAEFFAVKRGGGGCELVPEPSPEPCEDISLQQGYLLQIEQGVVTIRGDGAKGVEEFSADVAGMRGGHPRGMVGKFSPDGRKVLLVHGPCHNVVWAFADGGRPRRVKGCVWDVVFAADSSALLGTSGSRWVGGREVVVFDLQARKVLTLKPWKDVGLLGSAITSLRPL